ncbi:MAG: 16S rRNA (guanine(527)-N(7))-methyltransferase RsmG [Clostridia bacterium]|nr:16S rRNA (guanine(527)-N(7))-methyltransferase RsmG [Clostridia bacterium]
MTYNEFRLESERLFKLNTVVNLPSEDKLEKLYSLTRIMLEVNEHMNLTAITDYSQIILKHYIDSLSVSAYIPENASIIDIGCGAGFPCLPLAICREDIKITALDSTAKRIAYVQDTADKLGLSGLSSVATRAEAHGNDAKYRESYDMAVARAVADLPVLCELCLPLVKVGGRFAAMKAAKGEEEFARAASAIKKCGGARERIIRADLTSDGIEFEKRCLIITEKVAPTPKNYPRNFAQISKKPL